MRLSWILIVASITTTSLILGGGGVVTTADALSFISLSTLRGAAAAVRKPITVGAVIFKRREHDQKIMSLPPQLLGCHHHYALLHAVHQQQQDQDPTGVVMRIINNDNNNSTCITTSTSNSEPDDSAPVFAHGRRSFYPSSSLVQHDVEQSCEFPLFGTSSSSSNVRMRNNSIIDKGNKTNVIIGGSTISRRQWLAARNVVVMHSMMILAAVVTAATIRPPPRAYCWSSIVEDHDITSTGTLRLQTGSTTTAATAACQSGPLMAETAIPGAYEQDCMQLPVRIVPVTIPTASQSKTIELQIEQGSVAAGTTGLAVWNSSLLLSRLLSQLATRNSFLQNKNVLELGCGTGLVSLTAALLGASRVVATDGNPHVVALVQRNIQANTARGDNRLLSSCDISARQLSWGLMDAMDYSSDNTASINWVIGSDLTYNAASWRILAETMAAILVPNNNNNSNSNSFVLYLTLGHAGFNVNAEMDGFLTVAQEQGLQQVQPGDADWPFIGVGSSSSGSGSFSSLTSLLLQECINTPEERAIVDATGGARVVLLRSKNRAARR